MRRFVSFLFNFMIFATIIVVALAVATVGLTRKVNKYREEYRRGVMATVFKEIIPILSFTRGTVKTINIHVGQEVKKGDVLVEIDNPALRGKIAALQQYGENVSAQTEAQVAQVEIRYFIISAPADGIIGEVQVTEGSPVEDFTQLAVLYANENTKFLSELTVDQYAVVSRSPTLLAYSKRLNQHIRLKPDILKPDQKDPERQGAEKKIGLYFTLLDSSGSAQLVHNEDVELLLSPTNEGGKRPIDYFVDFWNGMLEAKTTL